MNYLDIINRCLIELNYKQVNTFSELVKNEHKKIKNIINLINTEVCTSSCWQFLQRKLNIVLPENTGEVLNNVPGRIETIIIDKQKLEYHENFEDFFMNTQPPSTYSFYDDKILLPLFDKEKTLKVLYYTKNCAKDFQGTEKFSMENADDESLIPENFAEPLLVYGTCMRLKGNPQHIRFSYWLSMYNDALANLRSKIAKTADYSPSVKLFRK